MATLDDLRVLRTFLVVSECGSMTRAAETLGYAQSSITAQISGLEASLGTTLLERRRRGVALTDAGAALLRTLGPLFRAVREAEASVAVNEPVRGEVRIAVSEPLLAYRLPEIVTALRRDLPHVTTTFCSAGTFGFQPRFVRGCDFGIVIAPSFERDQFDVEELDRASFVCVRSPQHEGGTMPVLATCSVRSLFAGDTSAWTEYDSLEAIKRCVLYGLGVGFVPRFAVEADLRTGRLVLDGAIAPVHVPILRVRPYDRRQTAAATAAWRTVSDAMAPRSAPTATQAAG